MHVHSKRLKLNILLTTYEILLKDKVSSAATSLYHGSWSCCCLSLNLLYVWHNTWCCMVFKTCNKCVSSHFWAVSTGPSLVWMKHTDWRMMTPSSTRPWWISSPITGFWSQERHCRTPWKSSGPCCTSLCPRSRTCQFLSLTSNFSPCCSSDVEVFSEYVQYSLIPLSGVRASD